LRAGKAPGPSGLRTDDIKCWAKARDNEPEPWNRFVSLVTHCFQTNEVPKAACISTLVLIPKASGGVRGIGLLESVWKVISMIIKERMQETIQFDDMLHVFRPPILQARLHNDNSIHQGRTLSQVFLDLSKAYDTLDRPRTLALLQAYGLGPNLSKMLENFWNNLRLVPCQSGFYGRPIRSERGVTQGDPLSPIIFNVVVDAIVRNLRAEMPFNSFSALFYADDGWLASQNPAHAHQALWISTDLFRRMGLQLNVGKTKSMCSDPGNLRYRISTPAYNQRMTGVGLTYSATKRQLVQCTEPGCNAEVQAGSLRQHMITQHNKYVRPSRRTGVLAQDSAPPAIYHMEYTPNVAMQCPVPNCPGRARGKAPMFNHFGRKHWRDTLIFNGETIRT
jgi:Reverse transcriptase (RNA-dependent DNA polymerase)